MEIQFADAKLQKICGDDREAQRKLGSQGATKLRTRLADLDAASCLRDVLAGRPHPLLGNRLGQFSLDLDGGRRLVFVSVDAKALLPSGAPDWPAVTAIKVIEIGDYHD